MKNGIALSFLALLWNAVAVSANCQSVTLTFNFKPKFPYRNSVDYACGDLEEQAIEAAISTKLKSLLVEFEVDDVTLGNMKTDSCPAYTCEEPAGHKCVPYCIDLTICGLNDLSAFVSVSLTQDQIDEIKTNAIDEVRNSMPDCLGIKNQFMMDVHASLAGLA